MGRVQACRTYKTRMLQSKRRILFNFEQFLGLGTKNQADGLEGRRGKDEVRFLPGLLFLAQGALERGGYLALLGSGDAVEEG